MEAGGIEPPCVGNPIRNFYRRILGKTGKIFSDMSRNPVSEFPNAKLEDITPHLMPTSVLIGDALVNPESQSLKN